MLQYQTFQDLNMGEPIPSHSKKFNTELTDYSVSNKERTGPYAKDLEVDALVVGAGFGMYQLSYFQDLTSSG